MQRLHRKNYDFVRKYQKARNEASTKLNTLAYFNITNKLNITQGTQQIL